MATTIEPPATTPPGDGGQGGRGASSQRRVAGATGILMVGILGSRFLGLIRDHIIAQKLGQGFQTDIYNAAFTLPDLLLYLIAGGALSSAFIPIFTEYLEEGRENEAWRLFSVVFSATAIVVGVFIVLAEIFARPLVVLTNPGYHTAAIDATTFLTRILLPAQICFFLGGLMMGTLQVRGNFVGQALGPCIYNLGIILGAAFLGSSLGAEGMCWGALGGAIVGNLLLQYVLMRRAGGRYNPRALFKYWGHPGAKQVWRLMVPIILGLSLPQVSAIVNKWFASYLATGSQSALMNANRLMQVPLGVFAQAIGMAIFPTLSLHAARKDMPELRRTANYGLRFTLFLTIPTSVLMIVLALPFVQLLLQSGKFKTADAMQVDRALIYYSLGIFAWSAHTIVSRVFYSLKNTRTPVIIGTIVTLFVFIPLNRILMKWMGSPGLAFATSIAAAINMGVTLFLLSRHIGGIYGGKLLRATLKICFASAITGAICWLTREALQSRFPTVKGDHIALHAGIILAGSLAASTLVYLILALGLRMEEANLLRKLLLKVSGRTA